MADIIHKNLAGGAWRKLSLVEQLGNIGSEISRAISWSEKGDAGHREKALERALELFDLTIADPRWKKRLTEITRAREVVCDRFYGDNYYKTTFDELEKYFNAFGLAARHSRNKSNHLTFLILIS